MAELRFHPLVEISVLDGKLLVETNDEEQDQNHSEVELERGADRHGKFNLIVAPLLGILDLEAYFI